MHGICRMNKGVLHDRNMEQVNLFGILVLVKTGKNNLLFFFFQWAD